MVTQARKMVSYRDSNDVKVFAAGTKGRTGRTWRAREAVAQTESRLHYREPVGTLTSGWAGLGSSPIPCYNKTQGKERRQLVRV